MDMDIFQASAAYERWLAGFMKPIAHDLRAKHKAMRKDAFTFFRATFYRWAQLWTSLPPDITGAPAVAAIGDAHLENFGTWRDREGRLVWGVNDFDEATVAPYTNDLVRVAVSGLLARDRGMVATSANSLFSALLGGYSASLAHGGSPFVIEENNAWLRRLALNELRAPKRYWTKLAAIRPWRKRVPRRAAELLYRVPRDASLLKVVHRLSGAGSLGRPRLAALFAWRGSYLAREVKARAPSAWLWANKAPLTGWKAILPEIWKRAVRCPDPGLKATGRWIVRRLAPDCSRIDMAELPRERHERALFRAMGWEIANIHCGSPNVAAVRQHLGALDRHWLRDNALLMAAQLHREHRQWRAR